MKEILEGMNIEKSLKEEILKEYNRAVTNEAIELSKLKEVEYEEYMYTQLKESRDETIALIDSLMEKVVDNFVEDNTFVIDESIKHEKTEAILEGFNSMTIATGVEIAQITESKNVDDASIVKEVKSNLKGTKALADALMSENIELKSLNNELLTLGIIKESAENMTIMQKDKFFKLANVVDYNENNPKDYLKKIDTIVESLESSKTSNGKDTKIAKINESKTTIVSTNSRKKEYINEKYVSSASHLYK